MAPNWRKNLRLFLKKKRTEGFWRADSVFHFYGRIFYLKTIERSRCQFHLRICFLYGPGQIALSFRKFLTLICRIIRPNPIISEGLENFMISQLPISSCQFTVPWWYPPGNSRSSPHAGFTWKLPLAPPIPGPWFGKRALLGACAVLTFQASR